MEEYSTCPCSMRVHLAYGKGGEQHLIVAASHTFKNSALSSTLLAETIIFLITVLSTWMALLGGGMWEL